LVRISCITTRVCESSAPKGSSISMTCGLVASARTMPTRCFMPPDKLLRIVVLEGQQASQPEQRARFVSRALRLTPFIFRPNSTFLRTLSHGNSEYC
jgi:hypothetical protein